MADIFEQGKPGENLPKEHRKIYTEFNKVFNSEKYTKRRKDMDRWLAMYEAKLWELEELDEDDSRIQVNYIFGNVQALCPLLTDNKPIWNVRARDPIYQNLANIYSKALECLWDIQDWDNIVYKAVFDSLLWPIGLTKTYWDPEDEEVQVDVVDPRTFCIPEGYDELWDAPWCGVKTSKPMSWIAMNYNDKLGQVKPEKEQDGSLETDWNSKTPFELEGEAVTVYEIWIRDPSVEEYMTVERDPDGNPVEDDEGNVKETKGKRKKYPNGRIITMTKDVVLEDRESPFDHGKPPYVAWYDYRVPHDFWGMGEPQQIEGLHIEYNKQLQVAVKHSRLAQDPNYTIDTTAVGEIENIRDTFAEGGQMYPIQGTLNDEPIKKIEVGDMDRAVMVLLDVLPAGIENTSGITDLTKGMAAKKERQSASEVSIMIESSYTRVRQKVRNVEGSVKKNEHLAISLMNQNYIKPRYFSYKQGTDEGDALNFMQISNTPEYFKEIQTPERLSVPKPGMALSDEKVPESDGAYNKRLDEHTEYQESIKLLEKLGKDAKRIDFKFTLVIETNSMLPQDKQTLANTLLRLAEIQVTPASVVDDVAVLGPGGMNVPNWQAIVARQKKAKEQVMAAKQGPPVAAGGGAPMGGPRPVPVPQNPADAGTPAPQISA